MGFFDMFRSAPGEPEGADARVVQAAGSYQTFNGLTDPRLVEFMHEGSITESGATVNPKLAMRNTTVFRCVSLLSFSIGMLPLHVIDSGPDKEKASDHPLFKLLHRKPNNWQSAFDFRSLMQMRALVEGDAYALIVRSGGRIIRLIPLDPKRVKPKQRDDWDVEYHYTRPDGGTKIFQPGEIFHLRGLSEDGVCGLSLVKQAAEAIGLAQQAEKAAARLFRNGMMVGGALKHKNKLSPEAYDRLKASMENRESAENAHKWLILEEDMDATPFSGSARDNQHAELRKHQIAEIGRVFGVPRPLLMMDETSWGSGIDVLGQLFVRYGLNPWFEAWQQGAQRSLFTDREAERYQIKFNPGALLRGNMKDQADFFAKALGSGGHSPWMEPNEVRLLMDLGEKDWGDGLSLPTNIQRKGDGDESSQTA